MRLGANGSAATFSSTKMKIAKRGKETQSEATVIGAFQDSLLPRSRPTRSVMTAQRSTAAPRKSTRFSLVFQSKLSALGNLRANETTTNARAQRGTCPKKALLVLISREALYSVFGRLVVVARNVEVFALSWFPDFGIKNLNLYRANNYSPRRGRASGW